MQNRLTTYSPITSSASQRHYLRSSHISLGLTLIIKEKTHFFVFLMSECERQQQTATAIHNRPSMRLRCLRSKVECDDVYTFLSILGWFVTHSAFDLWRMVQKTKRRRDSKARSIFLNTFRLLS